MRKAAAIAGQIIAYGLFVLTLGWLSTEPAYKYADEKLAVVKLSLSHAAERIKPCVLLTPQQIAELPPNMRQPEQCERERLPLVLELDVDGETVYQVEAAPSGLWNDGPASIYEKFELPPGTHRITARLRDARDTEGWDYQHSEDVELEAGRYLTVTFRAEKGGFRFQ